MEDWIKEQIKAEEEMEKFDAELVLKKNPIVEAMLNKDKESVKK